jgi:hypothetical protein
MSKPRDRIIGGFRNLVIGLVLSLASGEANAVFYGNDVHLWCQSSRSMALAYAAGLVDQSARISYTLGVTVRFPHRLGGDNMNDAVLDYAGKMLVGYCIPDEATMEQVTDVFCSYLRDTPQDRHTLATFVFQRAMQKAWPCSKP